MSKHPNADKCEEYLSGLDVKYTVQLVGDTCPPFCEDRDKLGIGRFPRRNHIHGQEYRLTLERSGKVVVVQYWNSYHDVALKSEFSYKNAKELKEAKVRVVDVLACMEFYVEADFEDWAREFGYDSDSIKAKSIHELCMRESKDFKRMFSRGELETLTEIVRDWEDRC